MIVIRHIYSRDLLVEGKILDLWDLPSQSNIHVNIRVTIGFEENNFEEVFDSAIITGSLVKELIDDSAIAPYGGKVFKYKEFEPVSIKSDIYRKIFSRDRIDFRDSISELSKIMEWDFEGM